MFNNIKLSKIQIGTTTKNRITEYNNKSNQKTSGEIQKNILPIVGS
jgi:hypothetical protein